MKIDHGTKISLLRAAEDAANDNAPAARWTMALRGLIAAYLVGVLVSGLELNPWHWSELTCAMFTSFFVGWLVVTTRD